MDHREILDNEFSEHLNLQSTSKDYLLSAAKWAKYLSIFLYLLFGYSIYAFIQLVISSQSSPFRNYVNFELILIYCLYLVGIIFTLICAMQLRNFSQQTARSFKTHNEKLFEMSMESLKNYLKYFGIFLLTTTSVYAIVIIIFLSRQRHLF